MKDYKTILEGVVNIINTTKKSDIGFANICTYIGENCPELKESEDEKIRKALIKYYSFDKDGGSHALDNITPKQIVAWLEKQSEQKSVEPQQDMLSQEKYAKAVDKCVYGEQNPADKVEPKFKVGDFIVNDYCMGKVMELTNDAYLLDTEQSIPFSCEHNAHLWTIQDAKDGDVLAVDNNVCIFDGTLEEGNYPFAYCGITIRGFESYNGNLPFAHDNNIHPATKEQREQLKKAMADAGYTFDFEKKELKKIEQNPAWSEEDEITRKALINLVEMYYGGCFDKTEKNRLLNFLKSLRPQNRWKPSDEQMEALREAVIEMGKSVSCCSIEEFHGIESLYNDLKKLREK